MLMEDEIGTGGRLLQGNARSQPRHNSHPITAGGAQLRLAIEQRLSGERQPNVNHIIERDAEKTGRRHADDVKGAPIDRDALADGGGVARKLSPPEAVADYRHLLISGYSARRAIDGRRKGLAERGLNPQRGKIMAGCKLDYSHILTTADIYPGLAVGESENTGEDLIALPKLLELRIGETCSVTL